MRIVVAALPLVLFAATFCFGLGLILPIAVFESFIFFSETPSLVDILAGLWHEGDVAIAAIVGLFSVAFPAAKLVVLHMAAYHPGRTHWVERVGILSKWSMADVLVVALAIFAAKTSGLASAATQAGIWFYAAATLLSAAAALILTNRARIDR
ncbi:MAG: paraquat-inducible protein A [Bauldia sp.]|uniref:paraquat-inducible protein A n=1 Tax=Bauldia sp. TaxID=2575872 RepID=UPI001DB1BBC4|nr:paraquat-inducible protein A [Bauldia sp.]MCB1496091.1 paraquat-inducible protein A [Bauldia sp.]